MRPWLRIVLVVLLGVALSPALPGRADGTEDPQVASPPTPPAKVTRLQGSALVGRREPVVGAAVAVRPSDVIDRFFVTCTDDKGRFRIDGVPEGLYDVILLKAGYARIEKKAVEVRFPFRPTVEVQMSRTSGVEQVSREVYEFPPAPVSIEGRMVDREGQPVPDVLLRLVRQDGSLDPRTARSGSDGAFRMDDVPTGWWDVEVRAVGFLPVRAPVPLRVSLKLLTQLVPHPSRYESAPIDLLPKEVPIPPASLFAARPDAGEAAGEPAAEKPGESREEGASTEKVPGETSAADESSG